MNLQEQYRRLFRGRSASNDAKILKESSATGMPDSGPDEENFLKTFKYSSANPPEVDVMGGEVNGMDREAYGQVTWNGIGADWTLETGDGMTSIFIGDTNLEYPDPHLKSNKYELEDLYNEILDQVNAYGLELDQEESGDYDW